MTKRAEQVDLTRQHIAAAAARLHTTVGPANTSIAGIAEEAGVTRLTVYRHFPDFDGLFAACRAHWRAENPPPDATAWAEIDDLERRTRRALSELYAWYRAKAEALFPIYRDLTTMPLTSQQAVRGDIERLTEAICGSDVPEGVGGPHLRPLIRHLVDYRTWRSFAVEQGLQDSDVVELGMRMLAGSRSAS
jgi:AcrR family transcriptional regulator